MTPKKKLTVAPSSSSREGAQAEAVPGFQVSLTDEADHDLAQISDAATREAIVRRALELGREPLKLGKPLTGKLQNFRSLRAAGQRYRIVYQVAVQAGRVVVVIGIRKAGDKRDVYAVAAKRLK